jgi:hypothetical protein
MSKYWRYHFHFFFFFAGFACIENKQWLPVLCMNKMLKNYEDWTLWNKLKWKGKKTEFYVTDYQFHEPQNM